MHACMQLLRLLPLLLLLLLLLYDKEATAVLVQGLALLTHHCQK
jgi:hypothetical protein